MRTPWRYLSDLVSKKPTEAPASGENISAVEYLLAPGESAVEDAQTVRDTETSVPTAESDERIEQTTQAEHIADVADNEGHPSSFQKPVFANEEVEPPADTAEAGSGAISEAAVLPVSVLANLQTDIDPGEPVDQKQVAKNARRTAEKQATLTTSSETAAVVVRSPLDEMLELESEIQDLRTKLSAKLAVQNDQLRKLIGRFDRD